MKQKARSTFVGAMPVALLALAAGCAPATAGTAAGPAAAAVAITPEMVDQGRIIYTSAGRCASCHGQQGRGGSLGPNLADGTWIWIEPGQPLHPQLVAIIRDGIETPREFSFGMPPMGGASLTEEQLNATAAYVMFLSGQ